MGSSDGPQTPSLQIEETYHDILSFPECVRVPLFQALIPIPKFNHLPPRGAEERRVMATRIYVGNLPFSATEHEVQELFEAYGSVNSVNLITDRETGRPRGFGFVEMEDGAEDAIEALNNTSMGGRNLNINEARPRESRPPRRDRW